MIDRLGRDVACRPEDPDLNMVPAGLGRRHLKMVGPVRQGGARAGGVGTATGDRDPEPSRPW